MTPTLIPAQAIYMVYKGQADSFTASVYLIDRVNKVAIKQVGSKTVFTLHSTLVWSVSLYNKCLIQFMECKARYLEAVYVCQSESLICPWWMTLTDSWHFRTVCAALPGCTWGRKEEKKESSYDHQRHKAPSAFIHILWAFPLHPSPSTLLTMYLRTE